MCLLWAIWLVAGPSYSAMQAYLGTVRCWLSDFGDEARIADAPNVLPVFWEWLTRKGGEGSGPISARVDPNTFLFERQSIMNLSFPPRPSLGSLP